MNKYQQSIDILTAHKANLLATKTFEEYRDAHVLYIEALIEKYKADLEKYPDIFLKCRMVDPTEQKPKAP